jgi:hypothetical protein
MDTPDHYSSTTSWRARVRFVRDLAPQGMGVFMAPHRSMLLRLSDGLYARTPLVLATVAVAWGAAALSLWPAVSIYGMAAWSLLVGAAWVALALQWHRAERPMLRPGASLSWAHEHVSSLWLLFLALASGIVLVYPDASLAHQRALCLILAGAGIFSAILQATSIRALAAVLGPTIGLVSAGLIFKGATPLAASVSLAGGIAVLAALGLFKLAADRARRDVETG